MPAARRAALVWGGAALAAVAVHGAGIWYALHRPPTVPMSASAPPAVMIDLAPEGAAPLSDVQEFAPDSVDAEEAIAPEALTEPEPPAMPEDPRTPLPDVAPVASPPELAAVSMPPMTVPELPRPPQRPMARPPTVEVRKLEAAGTPAPAKAQRAAKSDTVVTPGAAASRSGAGAPPSPAALAAWQARLLAHLDRHKRYPPAAWRRREEGVAQVRFTVDAAGNVTAARLAGSSGHRDLDAEALALVRRAAPVPPPPEGRSDVLAPIRFDIR